MKDTGITLRDPRGRDGMTTTTEQQQAAFMESVDAALKGLEAVSVGPCPGCAECGLEDLEDADDDYERYEAAGEAYFSGSPCEVCGSVLGGDREPWHAWAGDTIVHGDCCVDCLMYIANGELPDEWNPGYELED